MNEFLVRRRQTINQHRFLLEGDGTPAIVLLNGAGVRLEHWSKVRPALARLSATFAYDRQVPRTARSQPEHFGRETVSMLRELLAAAGLAPPFLLVGHSLGGLYASLYARLHPAEIAGIVLVDSSHPAQLRRFAPDMNALMRWGDGLYRWLDGRFGPGMLTEVALFDSIGREIDAAGAFPDLPLTVLTAAKIPPRWAMPEPIHRRHMENQAELAAMSPRGRQLMVDSGHLVPVERPEAIVTEVSAMLAEIRPRRARPPAP